LFERGYLNEYYYIVVPIGRLDGVDKNLKWSNIAEDNDFKAYHGRKIVSDSSSRYHLRDGSTYSTQFPELEVLPMFEIPDSNPSAIFSDSPVYCLWIRTMGEKIQNGTRIDSRY
jgi:hypothetical protein